MVRYLDIAVLYMQAINQCQYSVGQVADISDIEVSYHTYSVIFSSLCFNFWILYAYFIKNVYILLCQSLQISKGKTNFSPANLTSSDKNFHIFTSVWADVT